MRRGGGFIPTKVLTFRFVMDSFGRQIRATGLHDGLSLNLTLTYKHTTSIIVFFSSLSCFRCCYIVLLLLLLGTACYFVGWRFSLLTAFGIPPPLCNKVPPKRLGSSPSLQLGIIQTARKGGSLVFLVYKYIYML
jgi:hypothetical protein